IAEIEDTGIGISETTRRRIFEPLFTTKGDEGTGMGLTVSHGIVQEHDGAIEVPSTPGKGTRFILRFPAATDAQPRASSIAPDSEGEEPPDGAQRIGHLLVVDDEPMVRSVTAK